MAMNKGQRLSKRKQLRKARKAERRLQRELERLNINKDRPYWYQPEE
jgi:hypothetical protein